MGQHQPKKSKAFMRAQHQRHLRRIINATEGYKGVKSDPVMFEKQTDAYIKLCREQDRLWGDTYNIDRLPHRIREYKTKRAHLDARYFKRDNPVRLR